MSNVRNLRDMAIGIGLDGTGALKGIGQVDKGMDGLKDNSKSLGKSFEQIGIDAEKSVKHIGNQYKLWNLEASDMDKVLQGNKMHTQALGDQIGVLDSAINETSSALQKTKKEYGDSSEEAKKLEHQLLELKVSHAELNKELEDSTGLNKLGQNMQNIGGHMTKVGGTLTKTVTAPIMGIGAVSLKLAADFEQGLSNIKAVSGATVNEMQDLKELALKEGARTSFSALEASQGIEELIKAGLTTEQVLKGGLSGALDLAAAGELELGDAAEIASTALNAFRKDGLLVSKAADILAGAANASATDVGELKYGLSMVSAVASGVGLSFHDTSTALAVFAQNGLKGSDAGTSLKTMLLNLQPKTDAQYMAFEDLGLMTYDVGKAYNYLVSQGINPTSKSFESVDNALKKHSAQMLGVKEGSKQAQKQYEELLNKTGAYQSAFYDQNGKLKSMNEITGLLKDSMKDLTDAQRQQYMQTMFGTDAIRAANILFEEGSEGFKKMTQEMGKVTATETAAEKMNNLKGDIEELTGALETAAIKMQDRNIPIIRVITQGIGKLAQGFANLNPNVLSVIMVIGLLVATIGPAIFIFGSMMGAIGNIITHLELIKGVAGVLGTGLKSAFGLMFNPWILGIGLAIVAGVLLYKNWDTIKAKANQLKEWTVSKWNSIGESISNIGSNIKNGMINTWSSIKTTVSNAIQGIKGIAESVINKLPDGIVENFNRMKNGIVTILGGFKNIFSGELAIIKNIFLGAMLILLDIVTLDFGSIGGHISQIWENIKQGFVQIWQGIGQVFSGAGEYIKGYLSLLWESIRAGVSTLVDWFSTLPSRLYSVGIEIVTSLKDGISSVAGFVVSKVNEIGTSIVDGVKSLPSAMLEIGGDIIQGLINGLTSKLVALGEKASEIAETVKGKIKGVLNIHSPSRVMVEYGQFTSEGLAIGIENKKALAENAASELSNLAIEPLQHDFDTSSSTSSEPVVSSTGNSGNNIVFSPNVIINLQSGSKEEAEMSTRELEKYFDKWIESYFYKLSLKMP